MALLPRRSRQALAPLPLRGPGQLRNPPKALIPESTSNEHSPFYCQHTSERKPMFKTIISENTEIQNISRRSL